MKHWGFLHGIYGSVDAELEVQRTIERAELTAFFCLFKKVIGHKGIIEGLWRRNGMDRSQSW